MVQTFWKVPDSNCPGCCCLSLHHEVLLKALINYSGVFCSVGCFPYFHQLVKAPPHSRRFLFCRFKSSRLRASSCLMFSCLHFITGSIYILLVHFIAFIVTAGKQQINFFWELFLLSDLVWNISWKSLSNFTCFLFLGSYQFVALIYLNFTQHLSLGGKIYLIRILVVHHHRRPLLSTRRSVYFTIHS